jgi:hypothetical protein
VSAQVARSPELFVRTCELDLFNLPMSILRDTSNSRRQDRRLAYNRHDFYVAIRRDERPARSGHSYCCCCYCQVARLYVMMSLGLFVLSHAFSAIIACPYRY